ncbi:MAG TPA: ABC transporter permease [Candidatus Methylomirabilis sp.]|nr:ABC transporter permease [Candidatus Methylomirabilis sp.]
MAVLFRTLRRERQTLSGWLPNVSAPTTAVGLAVCSVVVGLALWQVLAGWAMRSPLFPTPAETVHAFVRHAASGKLLGDVNASMARLLIGWSVGGLWGIALGLAMGAFRPVRYYFEPAIQFLRFIPGIAWITPFTVWWGVGELSKVMLILYTSTFIVMLNTMMGVFALPPARIRAARCFEAGPFDIFFHVTLPSTVPFIVTGLRISMGNSFMILVAAEMLASDRGLGFLIFNSRSYLATDLIFVGIITLGALGLASDFVFHSLAARLLRRYRYR